MRSLTDKAAQGNERAQLAIDVFCYRIKKYIGAYSAVLGRVDAIVFTGGITKVLTVEDIEDIVRFFYKKILTSDHNPATILDINYDIWTLGAKEL